MIPVDFPQANKNFGPPRDLSESQVATVRAYAGILGRGSLDGLPLLVTAWVPSAAELEDIKKGEPIFITFLSTGLPPHMLTTRFELAVSPT